MHVYANYYRNSAQLWTMSLLLLCLLLPYSSWTQSASPVLKLSDEERSTTAFLSILPKAENQSFSWPVFSDYEPILLSHHRQAITTGKLNWFHLDVINDNENLKEVSEWVLHFPFLQTDITYVLVIDDEIIYEGRSGAFLPLSERSFAPTARGNYGILSIPHGTKAKIYLGFKSEREGAVEDFEVTILPAYQFHHNRTSYQLFNGIFIGFMLLMLLYNLFLYLQVKDRAFVYYSFYLFALLLFGLYNTGDLSDGLTKWVFIDKPQYVFFFKLSTYPGIFAYLLFLRVFLNLDRFLPVWDTIFKWLAFLSLPVMLIDATIMYQSNFNYASADIYTLGYSLVFLLLTFPFLFILWRKKEGGKKRYFIIGGVIAMGLGVLSIVIQRIQVIEYNALYFRIGMIVEVVIFSLGLAYRQRENQQSQQEAIFDLEKAKILQQQKSLEAKRLTELDEAKSRFYTHITHEFRTPLTVIMGITDQLEVNNLRKEDDEDFKLNIKLIKRNSQQLLGQINQLLELAKLESGVMPLNYVQADIIAFLEYLTESFHSLAEEKNVRLLFYPEERQLLMDFDETKLQYIVYNLLSNALKFSYSKGKIILHAKRVYKDNTALLQLKVSDTGQGISAVDQQHVFNRFYQVDNTQQGGTGVGLTLTKELVELMNGNILLESKLNEGSVFTVLLPIHNKAEVVSLQKSGPALVNNIDISNIVGEGDPTIDQAEDLELEDDKEILLLVEDNNDIVAFLRQLLMSTYQLVVAKDGKEGASMALELIPDIIISDVMMPEMNGLELTQLLKSDERTSHVPIILLTAKASEIDRMEGLRHGADAYLMKPFNKEELMLRLENLLALKSSMKRVYTESSKMPGEKHVKLKEVSEVSVEDLFIDKLRKVVNTHMTDTDFSTSQLSEAVGLSPSQLYRKLKAVTGDTPSSFIRNVRLSYSLELLKDPDLNISEVAYRCGFNDPNYFSRIFHKLYGQPPTHYRN